MFFSVLGKWEFSVFSFGCPRFRVADLKSQAVCILIIKHVFAIVCTWGCVQPKGINRRWTTEAGGPGSNKGNGWFMFPRVVSDSQALKRKEGGVGCVWSPSSWKQNVREFCQTANHLVIPHVFPPSRPPSFAYTFTYTTPPLTAGDPPGKPFPFLERGNICLFTEERLWGAVLDWLFSFAGKLSLSVEGLSANSLAVIVCNYLRPQ